jgi:hypothetical protein
VHHALPWVSLGTRQFPQRRPMVRYQ